MNHLGKVSGIIQYYRSFICDNKRGLLLLFAFSLVFTLLFNWPAYAVGGEQGFWVAAGCIMLSWFITFGVFLIFSFHWVALFLFLWGFTMYFIFRTWFLSSIGMADFNDGLLASILETNPQEASAYVNFMSISLFLVVGAISLFLARWVFWRRKIKLGGRFGLLAAGMFIGVSFGYVAPKTALWFLPTEMISWKFYQALFFPVFETRDVARRLKSYYTTDRLIRQQLANLKDPAAEESSCSEKGPLIVVVHVGEALRADRVPMNGFERNTMPRVSARETVITFPKVISFGVNTRTSIVGMLSDATIGNPVPRYTSFVSLFNKHGYDTSGVVLPGGTFHEMTAGSFLTALHHKDEVADADAYDVMSGIPYVFKAIDDATSAKKMIYINNMGNHLNYYSHEHNRLFKPDEMNPAFPALCPPENMANAYDNATVQNDEFIDTVIRRLEDRNAVYFYCADHGESLGEGGIYSHSGNMDNPQQRYVTCFVWFSKEFEKTHPEMVAALKRNAEELPVVSHDHFYHTVISLGGIKSAVQDSGLDLTSPEAKPYSGEFPAWPAYEEQLRKLKEKQKK